MFQILHRARHHGHDDPDGLKAVRADAHRVVPILTGKGREHNGCCLSKILGLGTFCFHTVAFPHVHGHSYHKHHVVAVILPCIVIRLCLDVNLHQAGRPSQLITVRGDTVKLIGHIKIPGQGYLAFINGAFVIETLLLGLRKVPGNGSLPQIRGCLVGHIGNVQIGTVVRKFRPAVKAQALDHIYLVRPSVIIQVDIHGLIHIHSRLCAIYRHGSACIGAKHDRGQAGCHDSFIFIPHHYPPPLVCSYFCFPWTPY